MSVSSSYRAVPRSDGRRLRTGQRIAVAIAALVLLPLMFSSVAAAQATPYKVLVFTKNATIGATEGEAAVRAAVGPEVTVDVTSDAAAFTAANLATYKAVVFLNTSGDVLDDAQQTAFETYFKAGGGFLGTGSAIETEATWPFMTTILGTRSTTRTGATQATIKVADRGHDATKLQPEYWTRTDRWYNFSSNVRGLSHVLATVDETTFSGGTMGHDHPIAWCKDYQGGRSFYTGGGGTAEAFGETEFREHLGGALKWAAGKSNKDYSDCGATVLANYAQTKISAPPNLLEPIGFDVFPDGRVIQTSRGGTVRLHDPATGTTKVLATMPVYTNSEDGLYGPAIDNDFATNKWVYLFYAPPTVRIQKCDGTMADVTTPAGSAPTTGADPCIWQDVWAGYFQLSRFKFVDGANPTLDLSTEQKIMQVANNRGACCHVGGDIDFDKHNNLWLVTGDDTPSGGGNSGGFAPFNDQKTNESQTIRVNNATGGTFTLTFDGQTTAPIAFNATNAVTQAALEALSNINPGDILVTGNAVNTANQTVAFRGQYAETNVNQITGSAAGLTGTGTPNVTTATTVAGNLFNAPQVDARRSAGNTNDLRGKVLRINVAADGSYTSPTDNLFPESADPGNKTRPEIYAMGFRNPFRIQVDENDVAYVTDYSQDSNTPQNFRGPAGVGRVEIVRRPSNYGWPTCQGTTLPFYKWNFNTSTPLNPASPERFECDNPAHGAENTSRWNTGLTLLPPMTQPDIWYSYLDNRVGSPLGTPCLAYYDGSNGTCPQLFPELGTGGVGPHGAAKYTYDPANPNPKKLPPYYDDAIFFGEFTRDYLKEIRLDADNKVFKINSLLDCGAVATNPTFPFECDNPMDLQFGPDGTFYLLTYGDGFFAANPDAGMYKFEYVKGQRAPQGVLSTNRTNGPSPLTVEFSSAGTRDLDPGDGLTFEWDFDDNGTVDSTAPNPTHTYTTPGRFTARMTVRDTSGNSDSKSTVITVGNSAPVITINVPADGGFFEWGQHIPYNVTVTDAEDASIDCSQVEVTFVLIHDTHGHAEQNKFGCSGYLDTDTDDASHGGYLAGGISVSYTDDGAGAVPALTTTKQSVVQLKRHQVEYTQQQSGTTVAAVPGGETDPGGGQVRGSLDHDDYIAINNVVNLTNMTKQITFRYAGGAAGVPVGTNRAAVEMRLDNPSGPTAATAILKSTGTNNNTYTSQTFPLDFAGSRKVYLVFRTTPGGPPTGFGNLNWVEFGGAGIALPTDTAPTTTVSFAPQSSCGAGCIGITRQSLVTLSATDDVEVETTEYRIDGGAWQAYSAPFRLTLTGGAHTFEYRSTDVDGNIESVKSASIVFYPTADVSVGATVPSSLSLTIGTPAPMGPFVAGVAADYNQSVAGSVTSTAGNAALSVTDPSTNHPGHLVNGEYWLPSPLQVAAGGPFAPVGGLASPTLLRSWTTPVSNDPVTVSLRQSIGAADGLRSGTYSKTLVFELSTTSP